VSRWRASLAVLPVHGRDKFTIVRGDSFCRIPVYADDFERRPVPILFYSHEPNEPPHIHVDRDDSSAKFWLDTVSLARNFGFSARELRRVQSLVEENRDELLEAWHGHFGTG